MIVSLHGPPLIATMIVSLHGPPPIATKSLLLPFISPHPLTVSPYPLPHLPLIATVSLSLYLCLSVPTEPHPLCPLCSPGNEVSADRTLCDEQSSHSHHFSLRVLTTVAPDCIPLSHISTIAHCIPLSHIVFHYRTSCSTIAHCIPLSHIIFHYRKLSLVFHGLTRLTACGRCQACAGANMFSPHGLQCVVSPSVPSSLPLPASRRADSHCFLLCTRPFSDEGPSRSQPCSNDRLAELNHASCVAADPPPPPPTTPPYTPPPYTPPGVPPPPYTPPPTVRPA